LPPFDDDEQPVLTTEEREYPPELWAWVVFALMNLRDTASQPLVLALFEADVVYEDVFGGRQDYLAAFRPNARPPSYAGTTYDVLETYERSYRMVQLEEQRHAKDARRRTGEGQRGVRARSASPPTTVGRNDPCLCGSGKKYKKCCGRRR
jgi:hypothetical protein